MYNYIREQSTKEIIRSTFEIYGKHFFNIFFTYVVLTLPLNVLLQNFNVLLEKVVVVKVKIGVFIVFMLIYMLVSMLATVVLTVSVSDICLGNKPSILRSYKRVSGLLLGKILATGLLVFFIVMIGFILLIVPGIIFWIWFLFNAPVIIIEGVWGIKALKRSKALGKGYYIRNGSLFFLLVFLASFIVLLREVLRVLGFFEQWIIDIFSFSLQTLYSPIPTILIILMYYDLRARKEAYDSTMLAEDLRH